MDPRSQVPAEVATALETPPGAVKLGLGSFSPASNGQIPDVGDTTIRKPTAGKIRISQEAIDARLRRVFTPNIKGQYKLSAAIVEQWKSKKKNARKGLEQLFQSCGFNPDWV